MIPALMTVEELEALRIAAQHCVECGGKRSAFATVPGKCRNCYEGAPSPYIADYRYYLKRFTPEQKARFGELMKYRAGKTAKAEAVDIIMREPRAGVCCPKCEAIPESNCGPDIHGLQSSWGILVEYMEMLYADEAA